MTTQAITSPTKPSRLNIKMLCLLLALALNLGIALTPVFAQGTTSAPSAVSAREGEIDVFYRAPDNSLRFVGYTPASGWSNEESLGGNIGSAPSAVSAREGEIDVFVRGTNNKLYHKRYDGTTWGDWANLGGDFTEAPACASKNPGTIDCVVLGHDKDLYHKSYDGNTWSGWIKAAVGPYVSAPALTSKQPGTLDLFARGEDNALWHKTFDANGWGFMQSLGGIISEGPAAVSYKEGHVHVFVRNLDGDVAFRGYNTTTGQWHNYLDLGGVISAAPSAVSAREGEMNIFVRDMDGGVAYRGYTPASNNWHGWKSLASIPQPSPIAPAPFPGMPTKFDGYRFDRLYYVQPLDSYENAYELDYWLRFGYRSLELSVIDKGDWKTHEKGPHVTHGLFATNVNCTAPNNDRLGDCLDDIIAWDDRTADNVPLLLFVDMKASWDPENAWHADEVKILDDFLRDYLGTRMLTYGELRSYIGGNGDRAALKAKGWPTIGEIRGKIIVVLTGGHAGYVNLGMNDARKMANGNPATIMCPNIDNDPEDIYGNIHQIGADSKYFFCANLKVGDHYQRVAMESYYHNQILHTWGHAGDFKNYSYEGTYLAVSHGATAIGWDISDYGYTPEPYNPEWTEQLPLVGERRSEPGFFKIKPVGNSGLCLDVQDARYKNGTKINLWHCNGNPAQEFVYTAEGQLRPKGNNKYCVDFEGGKAQNFKRMHLWDCDGGNSEKWALTPDGQFKNRDKNYAFCMDIAQPIKAGSEMRLYQCNSYNNQRFKLEAVGGWNQVSF